MDSTEESEKNNTKIIIIVILGIVIALGVIGYGGYRFYKAIRVPVETSQGTIYRSNVNYNINNGVKTVKIGFSAPDWLNDADQQILANDLCGFIAGSDWGALGINARNANHILLTIPLKDEGKTMNITCN